MIRSKIWTWNSAKFHEDETKTLQIVLKNFAKINMMIIQQEELTTWIFLVMMWTKMQKNCYPAKEMNKLLVLFKQLINL